MEWPLAMVQFACGCHLEFNRGERIALEHLEASIAEFEHVSKRL